jgi:hypothetical protein
MTTWPDLAADHPVPGGQPAALASGWEAFDGPAALRSDPPPSRLARLRWRAEVLRAELDQADR